MLDCWAAGRSQECGTQLSLTAAEIELYRYEYF